MKITPLRILFIPLILFPIIFATWIASDFYLHFTGSINPITNSWIVVIVNIVAFLMFLLPLTYRRKANWMEKGMVSAFFVSLFIEMYGIPLSILFASKYLFTTPTTQHFNGIISINVLGVDFLFGLGMLFGSVLMIIGTILIVIGWVTLYKNVKKKGLVTNGIYKYSRHPQYLGFLMVIIGWFFGWPTILVAIFAPILIIMYIRVCVKEEKEVEKEFGTYKEYKKKVPFIL